MGNDAGGLQRLTRALADLPMSFDALPEPQAGAHGALFSRVTLDLGATPAERGMPSETLLDLAQKGRRLPAALLERMYDAGRYVFLCSAGPETPPNLFGIWTGSWNPAWSGDYTLDTNVQLDIECALFWEDFLQGTEDADGHYRFCPSYSAQNGWADNSTQDISITRELLTNLVAACETLGIEAARVALRNRLSASTETATHGWLMLLPAIPDALPRGTLSGTRARGQILVDRVTWDVPAGVATVVLTSGVKQEVALVLPRDAVVESITADGQAQTVVEEGVHKQGCTLSLPKGRPVTVEVRFRRGQ